MVNHTILNMVPDSIVRPLLDMYHIFRPIPPEPLMYRIVLFEDLLKIASKDIFRNRRVLEIGPKDGFDSIRLQSLQPRELIMFDLPEKRKNNLKWLKKITCRHKYIEKNIMYLPINELKRLGKFDLIYCTGVLYHNPEQLRLLRRMFKLLNTGGYLVLESAVLRDPDLKNECVVKIYYPDTFRNTGTITHLPSKKAAECWLKMAGFYKITESFCYYKYNKNIVDQRGAWICRKSGNDQELGYYQKSGLNPKYVFGDSS